MMEGLYLTFLIYTFRYFLFIFHNREKHGWNATRVAPSFHESCLGDPAHKKRRLYFLSL